MKPQKDSKKLRKFFTAAPKPTRVETIAGHYSQNALAELCGSVTKACEELAYEASGIIEKLTALPARSRLSPNIFSLKYDLDVAIEKKSYDTLKLIILHLERLGQEHVAAPMDMEIRSINHFCYDAKLVRQWSQNQPKVNVRFGENVDNNIPMLATPELIATAGRQIKEVLQEASKVIPGFVREIETYVASVRLFNGGLIRSASDPRSFGAVYLRIPFQNQKTFLIEHLIHEVSHTHLNALMGIDQLILNDPLERFPSANQKDHRSMRALLHEVFVIWRLTEALGALKEAGVLYEGLTQRYERNKKLLKFGEITLAKNVIATELGHHFIDSMGIEIEAQFPKSYNQHAS